MANKTIKLGPNDIRCGNLIYHDEPQFIKLVDVAGYFSTASASSSLAGKS